MPFEITADLPPLDLRRHGPLVSGAWKHDEAVIQGKFLIDTGAGGILICESVAKALGLSRQSESEAHGLTGKATLNQYSVQLCLPVKDDQRRDIMFMVPVECQGIPDLSTNHQTYGVDVIGVLGRLFLQFVRLDVNGVTGHVRLHIDDAITRPSP
jgi:hypothetical protein